MAYEGHNTAVRKVQVHILEIECSRSTLFAIPSAAFACISAFFNPNVSFFRIIYHIFLVIRCCFFSFKNNAKNLDPSYKMDLDLWDCLEKVKFISQQSFI